MKPGLALQTQPQRSLRLYIAIAIIFILTGVAGWYTYRWYTTGDVPPLFPVPAEAKADTTVDEASVTNEALDQHTVTKLQPRYLSIPSLGIDKSRIVGVDLDGNNMLKMPKNINDSGWYTGSALPGSGMGVVLLDGRSKGPNHPGVFAKLADLREGDEIIITRGDGTRISYLVKENKTESLKEAITSGMQRMLKPIDETKEGLGIVTEAGNWIPRDKVYDKRVMLRAVAAE